MDLNGYLPTLTNHVSQRTTCHVIHFLITLPLPFKWTYKIVHIQDFTHTRLYTYKIVHMNMNLYPTTLWTMFPRLMSASFMESSTCEVRCSIRFKDISFPASLSLFSLTHSLPLSHLTPSLSSQFSLYFWVVFPLRRFSPFTKLTAVRTCQAYLAYFLLLLYGTSFSQKV